MRVVLCAIAVMAVATNHKPPIIISNGSCHVLTMMELPDSTASGNRWKTETTLPAVGTVRVLDIDGDMLYDDTKGKIVKVWLVGNTGDPDIVVGKGANYVELDTLEQLGPKGNNGHRSGRSCGKDQDEIATVEILDKNGKPLKKIVSNDQAHTTIDQIKIWGQ